MTGLTRGIIAVKRNANLLVDLKAYWKFDEASGSLLDATGRGNDMTDNNTVGTTTGKIGGARHFDGANSEYFSKATNADLSPAGDFTLAMWVWFDSASGNMAIFDKWGASVQEYHLFYNHAGYASRFTFLLSEDGSNASPFLASSLTYGLSQWHLVVAVWDSVAEEMRLSVDNGTFEVQSFTTGRYTGAAPLHIGAGWNLMAPFHDGKMDEGGIWHRGLTQTEVAQIWNSGNALGLI